MPGENQRKSSGPVGLRSGSSSISWSTADAARHVITNKVKRTGFFLDNSSHKATYFPADIS